MKRQLWVTVADGIGITMGTVIGFIFGVYVGHFLIK